MDLNIILKSMYYQEEKVIELKYKSLKPDELWYNQIGSSHHAFFPYASYSVNNPKNDENEHLLIYDDTYGEVHFNIYVADLTVKQLKKHYTFSDGNIYLFAESGGRGGDKQYLNFIDFLLNIYKAKNEWVSNNPIAYDLMKVVGALLYTKTLKLFGDEKFLYNEFELITEYIYEGDNWTINKLRRAFNHNNEDNLHNLMTLLGYKLNNKGVYIISSEKVQFNDNEFQMTIQDQFKIIIFYIKTMYYQVISEDTKYEVIEQITTPISIEELNEILEELNEIFKDKEFIFLEDYSRFQNK